MPSKRGRGRGQRQESPGGEETCSTRQYAQCSVFTEDGSLYSGSPESIEVDVIIDSRDNREETHSPSNEGSRNVGHGQEKMGVTLKTSLECVVCADNASGQYFGATVCLPCKSFYIRCTKEGEPAFSTKCHGNCDVTKQARIRCQSCRYQKCLKAGMTRREKPERIEPEEGQYLCFVCGDLANGIHFGVYTCEGCKKFFRRGLVENRTYQCKGNNSCVINPRSRNTCRSCRYRKCLSVGMSRDAIKMGRPKKKDLECCRVEVASPPSAYTASVIDETEEMLFLPSNESDSSDEIEMLEIKIRPSPPDSAAPLDYTSTNKDSAVDEPETRSKPTSTGTPWSRCTLQQMVTSLPGDRLPLKSLSCSYIPPQTSSTITSTSEYSTYEDGKEAHGDEEVYKSPFPTEQDDAQINYKLEAPVFPAESERPCHDGPSTTSTSYEASLTDPSALYSMSSDEIDSMLKLLEDFEKPSSPRGFRRRSNSSMEDYGGKRRKLYIGHNEDVYSGSVTNSMFEKFRLTASSSPSSWQQGKLYNSTAHQHGFEQNFEGNNNCGSSPVNTSYGQEVRQYSPSQTTTDTYSVTQPPSNEYSIGSEAVDNTTDTSAFSIQRSQPYPTNSCPNSVYGQECNCKSWNKHPASNEGASKGSGTSSRRKVSVKEEVTSGFLPNHVKTRDVYEQNEENQSFTEISKAFEVLYDKVYDNKTISEWSRRAKNCSMSTDSDSESDDECSCKCVQITGLCSCQGPPQQPGNISKDIYMSAKPSSMAGVWNTEVFDSISPYLFMKYLKQIPEFMDPAAMNDVQQKIMQNLRDSYLSYINNAEMKTSDQMPSSPEL